MDRLQRSISQEKEFQQQEFIQQDYDQFRIVLADRGWAVLGPNAISHDPAQTLERIGQIIPQYNGRNTFEVTYTEGFDDVPYSQSMNGLGAHTEAPAYDPPPRYLALLCHQQARCGRGQTLLADGIDFFDNALSKELREWALINPVDFVAAAKPGSQKIGQRRSLIRGSHNCEPMLRFSYNLFRYGNVNPSREDIVRAEGNDTEPLSQIAEEGERYFAENHVPVLIPDGCILVWNNHRLMHGRGQFSDPARHLTRYWLV